MRVLNGSKGDGSTVNLRQVEEELPVDLFGLAQRRLRGHVDGLQSNLGLVFSRAGFHAQRAAGAVFGGYLDGVERVGQFTELSFGGFKGLWSACQILRVVNFLANDAVRADERAFSALDTYIRVPDRDFQGDIPFLPTSGGGRIGAIHRHFAHRQIIAVIDHHGGEHIAHKFGGFRNHCRTARHQTVNRCRNLHLGKMRNGGVHGLKVLLDDGFAALAVSFLNALLDFINGFIARQYAGDGKEAGLHNRVDATAHAGFCSHFMRVDNIEAQFFGNNGLLNFPREMLPYFVVRVNAIQQENAAGFGIFEHVQPLQERELVAGDKIGVIGANQIWSANGLGTKAQVRDGDRPGFLGIIHEVTLSIIIGFFADDFDGIFIGAHGAISAQAKEDAADGFRRFDREFRVIDQAGVVEIIQNTDGIAVERGILL